MTATLEVSTHALYVRSGPGPGYGIAGSLSQGQQAVADIVALVYGTWVKVLSPFVGYVYAGDSAAKAYVKLLSIVIQPPPTTDAFQVKATTNLNVRAVPTTAGNTPLFYVKAGTLLTVESLINGWYKLSGVQQYVSAQYATRFFPEGTTPTPPPPPPISTGFKLPMSATKYGLGSNPGGWRSNAAELAVYERNHIDTVLWCAYEPNQQGVIADLRRIGVQHFVIRACIGGKWDTAMGFANATLPILRQFAQALGSTKDMMIQLGNEPNLAEEGWRRAWSTGHEYSSWWLAVAAVYRSNFPGCRLGFSPMSPGGDIPNVRMDERGFVAGCTAAINAADWICVHNYWSKADASDCALPLSMWHSQFGNKPIFIGESGPNMGGPNVTAQAIQHAHSVYSAANIPCAFFLADSSGYADFDNCAWLQRGITVNPNPPSEPAPQLPPISVQTGTSKLGIHLETTGGVSADILNTATRLHAAGKPWALCVVIDDVGLANALVLVVRNVIFRSYAAGNAFNIGNLTSEAAAQAEAERIWSLHMPFDAQLDKRIWVQTRNESGSTPFDYAYECRIMDLAKAQSRRAVIYGDSPGQPELNEYHWRIPALRQAMRDGHALGLHEYSAFINRQPSDTPLCNPATRGYFGLRHRMLYASVPADCRPILFNSETGLSTVHMDSIEDIEGYCNLVAQDDYFEGLALYGFGASVYDLNAQLPALEQLRMRQG